MGYIGVTGANGFLGSALCKSFAERGRRVIALCRRGGPPCVTESRFFDLTHHVEPALFEGVDVLVHAAHDLRAREGNANVTGTESLVTAARKAGVRQIVLISSMASGAQSASRYGREKYAVEQLLDPTKDLIIRPGLIVGDGGLFRSLYEAAARYHIVPIFSGGMQPVYVVGIADLCAAIDDFIASGARGTYTLAHPQPVAMSALYRAIAKKASTRLFLLPLPLRPVLAVVSFLERLGANLPMDSERLNGVKNLRPQSVTPAEACAALSPFEVLMEAVALQ